MHRVANHASLWFLAGIAAAAGVWLLAALDFPGGPGSATEPSAQLLGICLVRELLHVPCPGCGMTRALGALARGDWLAAVRFHPFSPLLALEGAGLWLAWGVRLSSGRSFARRWRIGVAAAVGGPPVPAARTTPWLQWIAAHGAALIALWAGRLASGELAAVLSP